MENSIPSSKRGKRVVQANLFVLLLGIPAAAAAAPALTPANATVGKNLQTYATVALSEPAPAEIRLTLSSGDPSRLLLSVSPTQAGSASISIVVRPRFRESPEFWLHALDESGSATYTASAPGYDATTGTVKMTPSGIVIVGPYGAEVPELITTPRGWPMKITLHTARLDSGLKFAELQYVRGGLTVPCAITSSNPAAGTLVRADLAIAAASDTAITQFRPAAPGNTKLAVVPPSGFRTPASMNVVHAEVRQPGLAVNSDMVLGQNLQLGSALSLGEPAPTGGVTVTLTSHNPDKLLFSTAATEVGKPSIQLRLPAEGVSTTYFLQALASEGVVSYTATAPGYLERTGKLLLAPSGVILSLRTHGPPDEAEVFRPDSAGHSQNLFVALLSERKPTQLVVYTAYLDPSSRRAADITVQQLRGGLSLAVDLKNSDPAVGEVASRVTIAGGSESGPIEFTPLKTGQTVISIAAPEGFAKPSNATSMLAIVRD